MKIYLVGGAVRDGLLELPIKDHDWVVVQSNPEQMLKEKFIPVGKDFPVFLHPTTHEEYALARTERKIGVGYTGFACFASEDVTIEEDLLRRDLTINAIAFDFEAFKKDHTDCIVAEKALIKFKRLYAINAQDVAHYLVDPFYGLSDLKSKTLKHVSEAFKEDPLRVLRLARFYAQFYVLGFRIDITTQKLIGLMVSNRELTELTKERVWVESLKALKTDSPHVYFKFLQDTKALEQIYPEFDKLINDKTLNYLEKISQITDSPELRFAVLLSDITKISIERMNKAQFNAFFHELRISNEFTAMVWVASQIGSWEKLFELSANEILALLATINYPRQIENLDHYISMSSLISKINKPNCEMTLQQNRLKKQFLEELHTQLEAINAKKYIDMGLAGIEIKEALITEKKAIITEILKKYDRLKLVQ
ncbi:multifunctional CCA tRNA nucleotidyl transferase/2'3'-cyclic phosphodiesterase/2'nucleotidase/phosphatase [Thorsellia kenyensis]|uniref:Multifunctional CCA tRNA nucleotidyl transferase/2'3'-cyclic phosphodiesterase/2'nucleotidase/phosphatase n=1 Tax=Thorsellia kenyensis TaxID=1549888 RepID=A0ABV6CCY1_9GAMM